LNQEEQQQDKYLVKQSLLIIQQLNQNVDMSLLAMGRLNHLLEHTA